MPVSIAIIGSGPAGFYTAEALVKTCIGCRIDIIERLPTPFGLIRGGVAPDHQSTKRIAKKFEKTALLDEVNYYGNVEVGRDVTLQELRNLYDAIILAVGAPNDRNLTIPGADKLGVHGSAGFVGWYNGHPDFHDFEPNLDVNTAVVIGNGNVAMDVARVLLRSPQAMAKSDLPDYARRAIHHAPIHDVYMFGRRGPVEAKFTNVELREMGKLSQTTPVVRAEHLPDDVGAAAAGLSDRNRRLAERNLKVLKEYSERGTEKKPKRVHFEFYAAPVEILGGDYVEGLRLERTRVVDGRAEGTGDFFEIDCGLIVAAIGYRSEPMEGAPFDEKRAIIPNDDGRVEDGLYAVGWIKRGPSGVISSNRSDGEVVADFIHDDFGKLRDLSKTGRSGFEELLHSRGLRSVSYADWKKIDALEIENATEPSPRQKFVTIDDMLDALDGTRNSRESA